LLSFIEDIEFGGEVW